MRSRQFINSWTPKAAGMLGDHAANDERLQFSVEGRLSVRMRVSLGRPMAAALIKLVIRRDGKLPLCDEIMFLHCPGGLVAEQGRSVGAILRTFDHERRLRDLAKRMGQDWLAKCRRRPSLDVIADTLAQQRVAVQTDPKCTFVASRPGPARHQARAKGVGV